MFAPDGTRLGDYDLKKSDVDSAVEMINKAHEAVNEKYPSKQTSWADGEVSGDNKGKVVAFLFVDDKDPSQRSLKAFDDRWVNWKTMDKVTPVKVSDLKGPLAEKYKVTSAPALVIANLAAPEAKQVLERKTGEVSARTLKKTLERCIEQMEKQNK